MRPHRRIRAILIALLAVAALAAADARPLRAQEAEPVFTHATLTTTALSVGQRLAGSAAAETPGGAAAAITWDFGDGTAPVDGGSVQHTYSQSGLFTVGVTASLDGGVTAAPPFRVVVLPPRAQIPQAATLSEKKVLPFQYVTAFGAFDAALPTFVEFRYGKVGVLVPATEVAADRVRAAAPPLPRGAAFVGGTASVTVIQGDGAAASFTGAGKVAVAKPPRAKLPPGEVTRSFIRVARGVLTDASATIAGSALDTPENADAIASTIAFLDAMAENVGAAKRTFAPGAKSASEASEYGIALSGSTVRQLDSTFAAIIAAGSRNTSDPQLQLVYRSWDEAMRGSPSRPLTPAQIEALQAAEAEFRDRVKQETDSLTGALNSMTGPLSTGVATLTLAGAATGNPVVTAAAADLALCSDVLTAGLVLGLSLDAAWAAANDDQLAYRVYMQTAVNLTGDFATGKILGVVLKRVRGERFEQLVGSMRDLANSLGADILSFQQLSQPFVPADASLTVSDASVVEGDSGTTALVFSVRLTQPVARKVSVRFSTAGGTASPGSDYDRVRSTVVRFNPGQTLATATVRVHGDTRREPDETFGVLLAGASGAPISGANAVGTIANDDVAVLTAEVGGGELLGGVSGCGYTTQLYLDGPAQFRIVDGAVPAGATATASGWTYSADYGSDLYTWEGTLTWNGDTLSGSLQRTDNPARPACTVSVVRTPGGEYRLTAAMPFTYYLYELDGSCTGPVVTLTYSVTDVPMQVE